MRRVLSLLLLVVALTGCAELPAQKAGPQKPVIHGKVGGTIFLGAEPAVPAPVVSSDTVPVIRGGATGTLYVGTVQQFLNVLATAMNGSCTMTINTYVITCTGGGGGGASTYDQLGSGTNVGAQQYCAGACLFSYSGLGTVDANYFDGAQFPISCGAPATNSAGQLVCQNGYTYQPLTYASLVAIGCTAPNIGLSLYITDSTTAIGGGAITSGGGTGLAAKVLALCDGAGNWTAH